MVCPNVRARPSCELHRYRRTLDEYGGDWSIARYIKAVETDDESARDAIMQEILDYNREHLEATWAVMEWLRSLA